MALEKGFIQLPRAAVTQLMDDHPEEFRALIQMHMHANVHESVDKFGRTVGNGEVLVGRFSLSEWTGLNPSKARRVILNLLKMGYIQDGQQNGQRNGQQAIPRNACKIYILSTYETKKRPTKQPTKWPHPNKQQNKKRPLKAAALEETELHPSDSIILETDEESLERYLRENREAFE